MNGRDQGRLAVVGGGVLRIYGVAHSTSNKPGAQKHPSIIGRRIVELILPVTLDDTIAPAVRAYLQADDDGHDLPLGPGGYWSLQTTPAGTRQTNKPTAHPLSFAEIETNAPYQPFHTDPRVKLFVYDNSLPTQTAQQNPWAFGELIPATKLDLGSALLDDDNGDGGNDDSEPAHMMENVTTIRKRGEDELEQVVVTTRRRRGRGVLDEREFFEDDCEVVDFAADRV